jgi:hypothetical protein
MKLHRLGVFPRFLAYTLAGSWLDLARYGGHFLDSAERALELLPRETRLKARALRAGITIVNPFDVFPGLENQRGFVSADHWDSSHDRIEYPLLGAICALLQPRRIFEFGTYHGEATLMLARVCPEARITTVNIPAGQQPAHRVEPMQAVELIGEEQIGWRFRGHPEAGRIEQILADTAQLDTAPHRGRYDFVWIDAGHSYANVKNDTRKAFEVAGEGAHIFWHDFDATQPGLTEWLLEFSRERPLHWIGRTSLVFARKA